MKFKANLGNMLKLSAVAIGMTAAFASSATTLRVSDSHIANTETVIALKQMSKNLEERTNGELKLQVFSDSVLGTESEMINQLRAGILDMVRTAPTDLEKFNPAYSALLLPYLFPDNEALYKAMDEIKDDLFTSMPETKFRGLAWSQAGARSFYTVNKPVRTPEDLAGLKIRVPNSQTIAKAVSMLGATPTPISMGESYTALQQGLVDGAEGSPLALIDAKHGEVVHHYTWDRHLTIPDILIISTKVWDKLSPEEQKILQEEADKYNQTVKELDDARTEKAIEQNKKNGINFYDVDTSLFQKKVAPLYKEMAEKNKVAYSYVERIQKATNQ